MNRTLLSLLAVGAFVYACFCAYLYFFQRSFIYFPTPPVSATTADELWIESDGERLRVWQLNAAARDAIVYFGGNAEDVALNLPEFASWFPHHALYLVNYRGYGGSSGSPSEAALRRDAERVFGEVAQTHGSVSLIGRSLGAAVALHVAAEHPVERLALVTPFDSLASLARDFYPIFPTSLLLRDKFDALDAASRVRSAVLVLVAEHDEIIPRDNADRLAAALPGRPVMRYLAGTTHNTVGASPEFGRALRGFLAGEAPK